MRVPPVQHCVREAVSQRTRRRPPDVAGSPDRVADRVVDGEPERARDEEPDADVDRPDRPDRDRCEDVHDVRAPDDEQRDVEWPDELAVLAALAVTGEEGDDAEQEHEVPEPARDDAEPLAPHAARADEAREHVEERAEVHHREPGEYHAVHVRGPDAAERQPRDAAEHLRRHELHREHEPEQVDDGQPEDRRDEPVLRGAVGEREAAPAEATPVLGRLQDRRARFESLHHSRPRLRQCRSRRDPNDKCVIRLSFGGHPL